MRKTENGRKIENKRGIRKNREKVRKRDTHTDKRRIFKTERKQKKVIEIKYFIKNNLLIAFLLFRRN